jgi:hypothetical protein
MYLKTSNIVISNESGICSIISDDLASVFKLVQLSSVYNLKEIRNLGKLIFEEEKIRKDHL